MTADVLLIEDDALFARVLRRSLKACDLSVCWVPSLAAARALLSRPGNAFRYALIDECLGDGFGLDLVPALDALVPQPAVALFTADVAVDRAVAALRCGRTLLPKPFGTADLVELLRALDESAARRAALSPTFALDADGLETPTGYLVLPKASVLLITHLAERTAVLTPASVVARQLLHRRDAAASTLVRRQVADTRRALGPYAWLIESVHKRGYRICPRIALRVSRATP